MAKAKHRSRKVVEGYVLWRGRRIAFEVETSSKQRAHKLVAEQYPGGSVFIVSVRRKVLIRC